MATTGYQLAANAANITGTFANLTNALAENDSTASFTTATMNATATMELTNFGFASLVPSGATIDAVNLKTRQAATLGSTTSVVRLPGASSTTNTESDTSLTTREYTNQPRPGGGSWTRNDILDGSLAFRFTAVALNSTTSRTYSLAWAEIEVIYSTTQEFERSVAVDLSPAIAAAGESFSVFEAAADVDASVSIATAGQVPSSSQIAFDAVSNSGSSVADPIEWTHTPVGTPRGVFVGIAVNSGSGQDTIVSVTYGGTAMTRVGRAVHSTGETGQAYMYFLGSNIPTGAQTVSIDVNNTTLSKWGMCVTVTAGADTQLAGTTGFATTTGILENPEVTVTGISGAS